MLEKTKFQDTKIKYSYGFFLILNDILLLLLSSFLAYYLRFNTSFFGIYQPVSVIDLNYVLYSLIFIITALIIMAIMKVYNWAYIYNGMIYYIKIISSIIIGLVITLSFGWLTYSFYFSRLWILLIIIFSLFFSTLNCTLGLLPMFNRDVYSS